MVVTSPPGRAAAPPVRRRSRFSDPEYRANLRYLTFGRAVPATLFGFMGWLQFSHLRGTLPVGSAGHFFEAVLPRVLYLLFCALPVAIYLTRPRPTASDGRVGPRAAALGGTTLQLAVGAFAPDSGRILTPPDWFGHVSAALFVVAFVGALWGLAYLRRSLSIMPEARRLTTGGPYRLVRHPLYCAEITAAVAVVLPAPKVIPVCAVLLLVMLQLVRTRYEERLLRQVFPEYAAYARRTRRLIPFIL